MTSASVSFMISHHPDCAVLCVEGAESPSFLQDILTSQIEQLETGLARPACLLTPQGRVLFDMMVLRTTPTSFLLITEQQQAEALKKRLSLYKLRRDVSLSVEAGWQCGHMMSDIATDASELPQEVITATDERHPGLGRLAVWKDGAFGPEHLGADDDWQQARIEAGIPQGADDLEPGRALMLEAGLHLIGGVDFDKGCYIGQEVMARTHYRGLVKRRIVPVTAQTGRLQTGKAVSMQDKDIGVVLSCHPSARIALASLRLEAIHNHLSGTSLASDGTEIQVQIPNWMMPLPVQK